MLTGSCHCKEVRYEITGAIIRFSNCHCDDCRKIHGTSYGANLVVRADGFKVTAGESTMTAYESSPGKDRCFCSTCGAHLFARMKSKPEIIIVRAGTLDVDPGIRPQMHIWVKAKAPWYDILDDLPQYQEGPPTSGR